MNKTDLIKAIASQTGLTQDTVSKTVKAMMDTLIGALKSGTSVTLVGFGTFKVTKRPARTGRNPRTGEPIAIPPSSVPTFSAGKTFKEMLNR